MRKQIVNASHLDRLPVMRVVYAPQNIETVAIQVNRETMGAMALEFGVEIMTAHPHHRWLPALLQRVNRKGDPGFIERALNLGEWLVALDDEIHVFPDDMFGSTFGEAREPAHEEHLLGIVTKAELRDDSLQIEGAFYKNPGPQTGFMDLGPGYTSPDDPNYQQQLPEMPQIN